MVSLGTNGSRIYRTKRRHFARHLVGAISLRTPRGHFLLPLQVPATGSPAFAGQKRDRLVAVTQGAGKVVAARLEGLRILLDLRSLGMHVAVRIAGQTGRRGLRTGQVTAANLGVRIAPGLALRGGMGFGDLTLFAAGNSLGDRGSFSPACSFDTLCAGAAGSLFGRAQCVLPLGGAVALFG